MNFFKKADSAPASPVTNTAASVTSTTSVAPATSADGSESVSSGPITYKDLMSGVLSQLKDKKGLLFKRTALIVVPTFILAYLAIWYVGDHHCMANKEVAFPEHTDALGVFASCFAKYLSIKLAIILPTIFVILYSAILRIMFMIEKNIWIDAAFDKQQLTSKQSFLLSWKLLPVAIRYYARVWIKYYLLPYALLFLTFAVIGWSMWTNYMAMDNGPMAYASENMYLAMVIVPLVIIIGVLIYFYILKIRLRNIWFIFLDTYSNGGIDFNQAMVRLKALNAITKSKEFKQILVMNLGADTIHAVTRGIIQAIHHASAGTNIVNKIPGGVALGGLLSSYGQAANDQFNAYANAVTAYIFYRLALKQISGNEQQVNMEVYNLVQNI